MVSNSRFNRAAERVVVVPELVGPPDEVPFPWRIAVGDAILAVDLMRSMPTSRLLDRVDRVPHKSMQQIRRAVLQIT